MSSERANGDGGAEALDYYLSRIAEHELLSREDEYMLGTISQRGQKARAILEEADTTISSEERVHFEHLFEEGIEARNQLVTANQRLVVSIAKKSRHIAGSHDFVDLIQYGTEGLIRAAEKFDPERGFKFSTYATWWINQSIKQNLRLGRSIVLPAREMANHANVAQAESRIGDGWRRPTDLEVSELSGVPLVKVEEIRRIESVLSLDSPLSPDGDPFALKDMHGANDDGFNEVDSSEFIAHCISFLGSPDGDLLLARLDLHPEHVFPAEVRRREGLIGFAAIGSAFGMPKYRAKMEIDRITGRLKRYLLSQGKEAKEFTQSAGDIS